MKYNRTLYSRFDSVNATLFSKVRDFDTRLHSKLILIFTLIKGPTPISRHFILLRFIFQRSIQRQ